MSTDRLLPPAVPPRRARRWLGGRWRRPPTVAVLRLSGIIGGASVLRPGLTLSGLAGALGQAFAPGRHDAVALAVSSPGGSPVQSSLIAARIRALAAEGNVPVLAFVEDVAASGGYWLACAADEIYVDASSIVGSIGVISAGFGLDDFIARHGIERRLHTTGARKGLLDPFRPERPEDVERLLTLQRDMHEAFKETVRSRRAGRLRAADEVLFEGDVWTGTRAVELGLVDGIGHLREVLRRRFGAEVRLRAVATRQGFLRRRFGGPQVSTDRAASFGHDVAEGLIAAAEERLLWRRYGL